MRFILFDRWGNPKGEIANPVEAKVTRSIGDEWQDTLDITCDTGVDKGDRLLLNDGEWREYVCTSPDETREQSFVSSPHFVNSVQELQTARYIDSYHETVVSPRRALEYVVEGTRWQVGEIATDMDSIELTLERVCGYDALKSVADTLGLEIATRIKVLGTGTGVEQRYVSLVHRVGEDTRQRFEFGSSLDSVRRTFSDQDVITRLYVYGKSKEDENGDDKPITITGVAGKPYLDADESALAEWGLPDGKGGRIPAVGVVEHSDIDSVSKLYDAAVADLASLSKPKVTYEASVSTLKAAGMDVSKLDIGDMIQVIDTCFTPALRLEARISEYVEDLLNEAGSTITLGSVIENVSQRQTTVNRTVEIVNAGKPVWDASANVAASAHDAASSALSEASGLTGKVDTAVSSAAAASTAASAAASKADAAQTTAVTANTVAQSAMQQVNMVGGMTDVTFTVAEFNGGLSATKQVADLPASIVAGPPPIRAQLDLWGACQPIVLDHDSDSTIPAGSIRVDVTATPATALTVRLAALKGATA
ncbi:phage tail spike protein [Bifidobacterium miconisargentati]|uniref:phage tail spike protein n=1 Tax=Bifidobacterium miconisargentati TaxID=2834437 RepID=UPI001BDC1B72|nr:phage tail spike protein [Bifidobacterium miconisargentati]MBW3090444.1 phage tail protein [Bifidobacterium miconisargentati]